MTAGAVASSFAQAMMAGDPAVASGWFAGGGRILTADGTEVGGAEGIQAVLAQIVGSELRLRIRVGRVVKVGSVALATQYWRRAGGGGDEEFKEATKATLVLSCAEGRWAILIASPWA